MSAQEMKPLKILAHDCEDLEVLSTFMQDAIIPLSGMDFDPQKGVFKIFASRFRWDKNLIQGSKDMERIHSGMSFHMVEKVEFKGFSRQEDQGRSLELLTMQYEAPFVYLIFAQEAQIRLTVKEINARLKDADDAWPAMHQPEHKILKQQKA